MESEVLVPGPLINPPSAFIVKPDLGKYTLLAFPSLLSKVTIFRSDPKPIGIVTSMSLRATSFFRSSSAEARPLAMPSRATSLLTYGGSPLRISFSFSTSFGGRFGVATTIFAST